MSTRLKTFLQVFLIDVVLYFLVYILAFKNAFDVAEMLFVTAFVSAGGFLLEGVVLKGLKVMVDKTFNRKI